MGVPSPSPDESVQIGSVIDGRYRVDALLGSGGMGRVYRAEHTSLGRVVAIKVLHADLGRNKEATGRFQREAIASGRLDHPNIVSVSDFGVLEDGSLYLVMEALEGEPLGSRLAMHGPIPWREAIDITRGVLAGLRHAHDRGVVHRDIKPDNIFLATKDGEPIVKILDFGIAKLYAGTGDDPAQTRAGLTVGTPAYLSPEQAVGGAITPVSDLYSTTIVLYEMLAGRTPFADKDPMTMLTAHVGKEPPPLHVVAPQLQLPPGLEDVVRRGLAKIAAERISSASDYIAMLDGVAGAVGHLTHVAPPEQDQSLAIPIGPYAPIATPSPSATPFPALEAVTPTPAPAVTTPLRATPPPSIAMPPASRPVSLAEVAEPIPRRWIVIAAVVVAVALVIAIVLVATTRGGKSTEPPTTTSGGAPADKPSAPVPPSTDKPSGDKTVDRDTELKALLHDLELGRTCAERKAAIAKLVALGDPRAIDPLKRARYRGYGGIAGIGEKNANACLTGEANAAIKKLSANAQ
jgi:serine/threonine-protein kinase